jgi:uncharacterized membrane protein
LRRRKHQSDYALVSLLTGACCRRQAEWILAMGKEKERGFAAQAQAGQPWRTFSAGLRRLDFQRKVTNMGAVGYSPFNTTQRIRRHTVAEEQVTDNDKLIAALSYIIWLVAVFVLISESNKKRPYQRYHAVQGLGFVVAAVIAYAAFGCIYVIITAIASAIADALGTAVACLAIPIWFVPLAVALWFAYRAYQGQRFEIPYVTAFLKGQGWL